MSKPYHDFIPFPPIHWQGHKLRLAMRLADLGFLEKAAQYAASTREEVIPSSMWRSIHKHAHAPSISLSPARGIFLFHVFVFCNPRPLVLPLLTELLSCLRLVVCPVLYPTLSTAKLIEAPSHAVF